MIGRDPFVLADDCLDLALLAAEQEFRQLERRMAELRDAGADEDEVITPLFLQWMDVMDAIAKTPPKTIGGCAVKLRILLHPEVGIETNDEHDIPSLKQVLDFLSRAGDAK
jgi:hypothetical protein